MGTRGEQFKLQSTPRGEMPQTPVISINSPSPQGEDRTRHVKFVSYPSSSDLTKKEDEELLQISEFLQGTQQYGGSDATVWLN